MIRLTFVLRRKPEMSFADFQSYWLETHAPLVARYAETLNIERYVQVHALQDPDTEQPEGPRGKMAKPYDGVAELWFASRDAVVGNQNDGAAEASMALLEDERNFIDHAHSPGWWNYECPQVNPTPEDIVATPSSAIVKLFYALHHPQGRDLDDIQLYWRMQHGPLVRRVAQDIGALRYIQVHRLEDELNDAFKESRGVVDPAFFGHAELWFELDKLGSGTDAARAAQQLLFEDEAKFIDFPRSTSFLAKEHVIVG